ncbi:unnamed protein product [Rotaria sp. Silwood2]|nr:unnamed protein product [Rotaria sp. Silwood2]
MSIIISIENLSNELLYKIFDYLDVNELFEAFSNLNYRFEQLLNSPLLLFKMKFHLTSYLLYTNFYEQMKLINKYQIYSLYVYLPLRNNLFFHLQPDVLLVVLSTLSNIPRLSSLTINNFNILKYSTDIYRIVFNLPLLKYFKFSTSNSDLLISLPTRTDEQYSSIKYLVIDHHCTLDEIGLLTSYTPQLDRLYVNKVAKNLQNFSGINLYHLNSIYLNIYNITFNELEIFLIKIYSNLKTLSMKCSNDTMFLNTHRWELLIMNYYPELEKFYLKYCDRISNDGFYKEKIDLSSSFWIKKKWIFGIEFSFGNIVYIIHPFSLTIANISDFILETMILTKIEYILTITKIYHLEIFEKEISISILIQILNLLSQIITLKIHSLSTNKRKLTHEEFDILYLMKKTSKITKVYLKQINNIKQLNFIFELCPCMKYFKVGFINLLNIQFFFRTIFKKMKYNNHHPNSLCLNIPTTDDKILENIKETIKYENLPPPFIIKRILDNVYLKWK